MRLPKARITLDLDHDLLEWVMRKVQETKKSRNEVIGQIIRLAKRREETTHRWVNDDYDSYLEPPTESRYVVCANCGEWIDWSDAYWDKPDTPYCDEYCCEEAQEGF